MEHMSRKNEHETGDRRSSAPGGGRTPVSSIRDLLAGGDLRSIGRVPEVLRIVGVRPERIRELVECLTCGDSVVRARAADALEKLTAGRPALLKPFKGFLLCVAARSGQQEVRWHLAQMLPRLPLTRPEIVEVFSLLRSYLGDRSVIVRVCALQAMAELARIDPSLRGLVRKRVEESCRTGTPAMRARGRKLLSLLKEEPDGL
jgi:hypothetical protein